jgi:hypothetical protein
LVKEVVAAAHEACSEEYEEQAAMFASNVGEAVWRGASGLGGAVMEAEDARWKVATRVKRD